MNTNHSSTLELPLWLSWERICLQCGRPGSDPWVGKIPWRRERLPPPAFWPGEFHGLYSPWVAKCWTQLSNLHFTFSRVNNTLSPFSQSLYSNEHQPNIFPESVSCSVVSDSWWPPGLQSTRLLCPWNSLGKNTGAGSHSLLQGIFLTQESNPGPPHCRQTLYYLSYQGRPMCSLHIFKSSPVIIWFGHVFF